jgi:hypothetical protein
MIVRYARLHCAARSFANFEIEGHLQLIDLVRLWFGNPHNERSGNDAAEFSTAAFAAEPT